MFFITIIVWFRGRLLLMFSTYFFFLPFPVFPPPPSPPLYRRQTTNVWNQKLFPCVLNSPIPFVGLHSGRKDDEREKSRKWLRTGPTWPARLSTSGFGPRQNDPTPRLFTLDPEGYVGLTLRVSRLSFLSKSFYLGCKKGRKREVSTLNIFLLFYLSFEDDSPILRFDWNTGTVSWILNCKSRIIPVSGPFMKSERRLWELPNMESLFGLLLSDWTLKWG